MIRILYESLRSSSEQSNRFREASICYLVSLLFVIQRCIEVPGRSDTSQAMELYSDSCEVTCVVTYLERGLIGR